MTTSHRRGLAVFTIALLGALAAAGAASGAGGSTIASAPIVQPGVKETGNTMSDKTGSGNVGQLGCWNDLEYYRVPLKAGDQVAVDGTATAPSNNFEIGLFPAGTTAKNIDSKSPAISEFPSRSTIRFDAKTTGTYVFVIGPGCYDATDGPYEFSLAVSKKH